MPRYILTHKRAGKRTAEELRASRKLLEAAIKKIPKQLICHQPEPYSAKSRLTLVLEAEPREIAALKKILPRDLILEREILHKLHAQTSTGVSVRGGGRRLRGTRITILFDDGGAISSLPWAFTGSNGQARLPYDDSIVLPLFVIAEPHGGFWSMFKELPPKRVRFTCPSLPQVTPVEWWHRALGVCEHDVSRGEGIRIGVVGTGVGPHPRLRHVILTDGKRDIERHETHVCGIIAARPNGPGEFAGIAPGATVFSTCVFYLDADGMPVAEDQGVIADAIDRLADPESQNGFAADLINLSFGQPDPSQVLHDAIQYAFERGTLCISSAGNNVGGPLDYPAAFPKTVAVTALGKVGWGPAGSTGTHWIPTDADKFGRRNLYLAGMSSIGTGVDCAAPGNGIISTIPRARKRRGAPAPIPAPYAAMDGTSLASPMVCGVLAGLLSELPAYLAMPRTDARARMARKVLRRHTNSIGLLPEYEGKGLPRFS